MNKKKIIDSLQSALSQIIFIIIGILLALQVDNWKKDVNDKKEEIKQLQALKKDFIATKKNIERTLKLEAKMFNYSLKLINVMESEHFTYDVDSVRKYLGESKCWYGSEPVTATYDALIASNQLSIISSNDLKSQLVLFASELNSGFEDHAEAMNLIMKLEFEMSEYVSDILPNSDRKYIGIPQKNNVNKSRIDELLRKKSFLGALTLKMITEKTRKKWEEQLLKKVLSIISSIEKELQEKCTDCKSNNP